MSPLLRAYLAFSYFSAPLWRISHRQRLKKGKELPERLPEKYGHYDIQRPQGTVIWFHALSVGESLALLPLIERALSDMPAAHVVLTTSTATSAEALSRAGLPERCLHILLPIDTVGATRRFLRHWKPDVAAFAELDFWPRLMVETHKHGIPMVLVNSRLPAGNLERRKRLGSAMRDIVSLFDRLLVQDADSYERFVSLGADKKIISVVGVLKSAARPLPVDEQELAKLKFWIGKRPVWLAAATWESEHRVVVEAHQIVRRSFPDGLLIIAPRHIRHGDGAVAAAKSAFARVGQRSSDDRLASDTDVYVADTIGEMGLWYRLAPISFVGHSIDSQSEKLEGKNPFEAAALGSAILHGPSMSYFADSYEKLTKAGAAREVAEENDLGAAVVELMDAEVRQPMIEGAQRVIDAQKGVLENTWGFLRSYLED